MKPMWTVAVSAMTMTLSVAVMAMVRLSLLTWMVWAMVWACEGAVATTAAARVRAERWRIFIGLLLLSRWSRAERQGFVCVSAWRRASVWGRGGRARAVEHLRAPGRWLSRL